MTEQILLEELQTNPLKVADIVSYLHHNGWQTVTHPNPRLLVFQGAALLTMKEIPSSLYYPVKTLLKIAHAY